MYLFIYVFWYINQEITEQTSWLLWNAVVYYIYIEAVVYGMGHVASFFCTMAKSL